MTSRFRRNFRCSRRSRYGICCERKDTTFSSTAPSILTAAIQQIGNEVLGSQLFLTNGVIVIYEREPVGRGGVVQLVNRGEGLRRLLDAARDHVLGCVQGCAEGCPMCTYVRDAHCTSPLDEIGRVWLPPNTLLSRAGARILLAPQDLQ